MANQQALEVIDRGVDVWNTSWAARAEGEEADLSDADLQRRKLPGVNFKLITLTGADLRDATLSEGDFSGADLSKADLERADLSSAAFGGSQGGAKLTGADLRDAILTCADFSGVDLSSANLERANLSGALFGEPGKCANLQDANLREAILRDCDLSRVKGGLRPQQLAGADLTGATLPGPLADLFKELQAVGDISESARKLFAAMLAACIYSWLTIATTTDLNLITNRASSPLPIIQTSIPIVGFYVVAPLLLLCVYFYLHFYLQKLWEELGSLPAIFPDGRRLHERSDPWLLNDLVRSHVAKLKRDRPFMSYFQQAISIVLAWWLVPITLFLFWGRYLPRHDFRWTTLQVILLAISITAAIRLYRLAAATLRGEPRRSFSGIRTLKTLQAYGASATFVVTGVAFMLLSIGAIGGVPLGYERWQRGTEPDHWTWVPRAMALVHYSPFANLTQADVSEKPPNWTGKNEGELDHVKGAKLFGADLRYAELAYAFLAKAFLLDARMEGASLSGTDLRKASLAFADLTGAQLDRADLNGAGLYNVSLRGAHLSRANLNGADLEMADLTGAGLAGADLTGAHLQHADLKFTDFRSNEDFGPAKGLTADLLKEAKNWDKAYYDDDLLKVLFPDGWRDHNAKLKEGQQREEREKAQPAANVAAPTASRSGAGAAESANPP